ncbi:uncharacterized protein BJ212DRAFT_1302792 [Suillus subaureus]|uniref:Uncharacterized protein n=1 Tax=Suillus subaureus TaxID=48587 RepID=A0A9P7E1H6_9AGAM|nr:uncharacterized protein BJ212DRAFT_1302792 [Suillus subaureus]KAG1808891.1 hypothetical protein BJ212DRAFT_1302792 [Suillus subaureus]
MTCQWFSSILFSWTQATYHIHKISPPDSTWSPLEPQIDQPPSTVFDWATWSTSSKIYPIIQSLYGSLPNKSSENINWLKMDLESKQSGNDHGPMVETDEKSWHRCLMITLELLEINIKKADTEATAKPAMTETELPMPIDMDTQPSVPASSKHPSSSMPAGVQKRKKAKISQSGPKEAGSHHTSTQSSGCNKPKGKEKDQAVKSAVTPGSGLQFSLPDTSGSVPGPSSSRMIGSTHKVTTPAYVSWEDLLTSKITKDWSDCADEIAMSEQRGDQSWQEFQEERPVINALQSKKLLKYYSQLHINRPESGKFTWTLLFIIGATPNKVATFCLAWRWLHYLTMKITYVLAVWYHHHLVQLIHLYSPTKAPRG